MKESVRYLNVYKTRFIKSHFRVYRVKDLFLGSFVQTDLDVVTAVLYGFKVTDIGTYLSTCIKFTSGLKALHNFEHNMTIVNVCSPF